MSCLCVVFHYSWSLFLAGKLNRIPLQKLFRRASIIQKQCQKCWKCLFALFVFPQKKKNESDSRQKHTRTCSHTTGCDGFISFGVICVAWCIGPQHCLITANLLRRSESMLSARSSESASSFSLPVHELSAFTCWILCFSFSSPIGGTRGTIPYPVWSEEPFLVMAELPQLSSPFPVFVSLNKNVFDDSIGLKVV